MEKIEIRIRPFSNFGFKNSGLLVFDSPERKIFLGNEAERDYNYRGQYFRDRGEDLKLLNKQFYEHIVQRNTNQHQQKVTEQLYPSSQCRIGEHNIPVQIKTSGETYHESDDESADMRTDSSQWRISNLFL